MAGSFSSGWVGQVGARPDSVNAGQRVVGDGVPGQGADRGLAQGARRRSRSRLRAPLDGPGELRGSLAIQTSRRSSAAPAISVVTTGSPAAR
jgi:hypothetical protein